MNKIMGKIICAIKRLLTYIKSNRETILRIFEVIFIGFASIYISIKANNISNVANKIAESQLEIMNAEIQPIFHIRDEYLLDDEGNETTQNLVIEIIDGKAENITIEPITMLKLFQFQDGNRIEKDVRAPYYYNEDFIIGTKQTGIVASSSIWGNYLNYWNLKSLLMQEHIYSNIYTILKINYTDIRQISHIEYYLFEEIHDIHGHGSEYYYKSAHLNYEEGEIFFNQCMNIDEWIELDYLRSEEYSFPKILELFK